METSKEIIKQAKQRFKDLKHKKYDEPSFFAGFLEAKALSISEFCACDNPNGFNEMDEGKENCSKCSKPY